MLPPAETLSRQLLAWSIHLFTASGAVLGFLALLALEEGHHRAAWSWLFASLIVDALDGWLARALRIQSVLPHFDGSVVDLIVDYFTYTIVPCLFLYRTELVAEELRFLGIALLLLSSPYAYARRDIKTQDAYFRGFPGTWNLVIFYMYVCRLPQEANFGILLLFVVLTFVPLKWCHPFRIREMRSLTRLIALAWIGINGVIVLQLPDPSPGLVTASFLGLAYMVGLGVLRTLRPRPLEE